MSQIRRSPAPHAGPVTTNTVNRADRTFNMPWRDTVDWWTDPRLAYAAGLADGVQLGRDQVDAELVAALARALGGPACHDYRAAVERHHRALDQKARREAHDRRST